MKIRKVIVPFHTKKKILLKHEISADDIVMAITECNPVYYKSKHRRYMALTPEITIIFDYDTCDAHIITAYRPSRWQKKLYARKR